MIATKNMQIEMRSKLMIDFQCYECGSGSEEGLRKTDFFSLITEETKRISEVNTGQVKG